MKREVKKCDGNDKGKRGDITEEGGEIITIGIFAIGIELPKAYMVR